MGFFGRLAKLFQIQLSPRAQRRMTRFREQFLGWIIYPFVLVGKLFAEIGRLVANWWSLRNMRFLLQGLPALLLAMGALVFGVVVYFQDRNLLATQYKYETDRSLIKVAELEKAKKDTAEPLARAETCAHRLAVLSPDDPERFQLARVLLAQKKDAEANAIIKKLAADGPNGFGPAHLWMADRLLNSDPLTLDQLTAAIGHLERATNWKKSDGVAAEAHRVLAAIHRSRNQTADAFRHQSLAAYSSPENRMILAKWYYDDKRTGEARPHAQNAANAFQARLQNNVDDHAARQNLIQCRVWLGEYDEAKMQTQAGLTLAPNAEVRDNYLRILLQTILIEYDTKTSQGLLTLDKRYSLLEQGLKDFPNDFLLLQRLVTLYRLEGDEGNKVRKVFADLMTSGQTTALANLILGLEYWQKDNADEARRYWEKALEASKQIPNNFGPLIGNNLAYVLAAYPPDDKARAQADLERAKDLIDEVVKKADEPQFHSTRGLILAKMERYEEALPELEKGIPIYKDDPTNGPFVFRQLAETSRKLGYGNSAVEYDRRADELAARAKASSFVGPPKPEGLSTKPEQISPAGTSTPDPKKSGDSGR